MAVRGNASIQIPAVPATPGPSVSKATTTSFSLSGITDLPNLTVIGGVSAAKPTQYSDLSHTSIHGFLGNKAFQYQDTGSGTFACSGTLSESAVGSGTLGDIWWVCVFQTSNPPSGGDVPDLVVGPFVVVA
jgi:hypothetical protein